MNILLVTAVLGVVALTQVSSYNRCEKGWKQLCSHCYFFSVDKQSWYRATFTCALKGGTLVAINSNYELTWIRDRARELRRGNFWTGGNDIRKEGRWVWNPYNTLVNSSSMDWNPRQPDDLRGYQDCMLLWAKAGYRWDDQRCHTDQYYICEKFEGSKDICSCKV